MSTSGFIELVDLGTFISEHLINAALLMARLILTSIKKLGLNVYKIEGNEYSRDSRDSREIRVSGIGFPGIFVSGIC